MTTAIIGTGNIGGTLARHLVRGGEPVVLAAKDEANAAALAQELGELARAASVEEAIARTLPEGQSAGSVVAALLPADAHYVKAFGTLAADALVSAANREPQRAVLFYATDDDTAATTIERLTHAAGFEPLKAGGLADAGRIEMPGGDLHQSGLNGALLDLDEARGAVAAERSA